MPTPWPKPEWGYHTQAQRQFSARNTRYRKKLLIEIIPKLVTDDKRPHRGARVWGCSERDTCGVAPNNPGLIGAEGALAADIHHVRGGVSFKPVVDTVYQRIPRSRKRVAALRERRNTQTRIDDTGVDRRGDHARDRSAQIVQSDRITAAPARRVRCFRRG